MITKYMLRKFQIGINPKRGAVSVEYVVVIVFLIIVSLAVIIQLVDPTGSASESILPNSYNAVSQKIGQFGTLPE